MRVRICAAAERGEDFLGEGQTIDVSHDGAAIMVDRDLSVGQTVKVRRVGVNKEAEAHVVGNYKDEMAIPYTSKAPNIFSLLRIVGARKGNERNSTEYRATYLV